MAIAPSVRLVVSLPTSSVSSTGADTLARSSDWPGQTQIYERTTVGQVQATEPTAFSGTGAHEHVHSCFFFLPQGAINVSLSLSDAGQPYRRPRAAGEGSEREQRGVARGSSVSLSLMRSLIKTPRQLPSPLNLRDPPLPKIKQVHLHCAQHFPQETEAQTPPDMHRLHASTILSQNETVVSVARAHNLGWS